MTQDDVRPIEVEDLREAGEDGGDLMGFYARGHHDAYAFAEACNKRNEAGSTWDRRHVYPRQVRHVWWRTVPMAGQAGCSFFATAEPNSRGSYPATVWDDLANGQTEATKRAIREHHRGKCNGVAEGVNWALRYVETIHGFEACQKMLEAFRAKRGQIEGDAL